MEITDGNKTLTPLQQRFCEEYILDWRAAPAARRAGYSESVASSASQLLKDPLIKEYIEVCKGKIEELAGISKLKAVKRLANFAFTDVSEFYNDWVERKEFNKLSSEALACIQEVETKILKKNIGTREEPELVDVEYVKIKTVDKRGAIQDLAKLLGWNQPDRIDHTTKGDKVEGNVVKIGYKDLNK